MTAETPRRLLRLFFVLMCFLHLREGLALPLAELVPPVADAPAPARVAPEEQVLQGVVANIKRRESLTFSIRCAEVIDGQWTDKFRQPEDDGGGSRADREKAISAMKARLDLCRAGAGNYQEPPVLSLVGSGDVVLYVPLDEFAKAQAAAAADASRLRLYLNGVDQGKDAELVGTETLAGANLAALRFHVRRGTENRPLWTALYHAVGLDGEESLRIALGWSSVGPVTPSQSFGHQIRITNGGSFFVAAALILLLLGGAAWVLLRTDTFRDAKTPLLWRQARLLRTELLRRTKGNESLPLAEKKSVEALRSAVLDGFQPGATYLAARSGKYADAAKLALDGQIVDEAALADTVFGLCLSPADWQPARPTFSLARVQLGMWFVFAVATGLFLWTIFGNLPSLPPSMLALMTVSAATTSASMIADNTAGGRSFEISRGFWSDLITGFDSKQQLHRFQAVVVNLMLLVVGLSEVFGELLYPTFDAAWLGLLGLSGVTLAMGKTLTEKASDTASPTPNPTASVPQARMAGGEAAGAAIPSGPQV